MATTDAPSRQMAAPTVIKPAVNSYLATAMGWLLVASSCGLLFAGTYQALVYGQLWGWVLVGAYTALGCLGSFELLVAHDMRPKRGYAADANHIWGHRLTKLALCLSAVAWTLLILFVQW